MNIDELAKSLKHMGLEPMPDGRSIRDGKRPVEQHITMVISTLKAQRDLWMKRFDRCQEREDELNRQIRENM